MSPLAIDEERFKKQNTFDVSAAPNSPTGLPMKQIPVQQFPMAVYKHPLEPFRVIEHRNVHHEVVHIETVQAEHLALIVRDEDELRQVLKDGWVREPYIAPPLPDPNAHLYDAGKNRKERESSEKEKR